MGVYMGIARKTLFTCIMASCAFLFFSSFNSEKITDTVPVESVSVEKINLQTSLAVDNSVTSNEAAVDDAKNPEAPPLSNAASIMLDSDILAFYGHPIAKKMGILGRYPKEELIEKLSALAGEYRAESGGRGIVKAFYIIYGTVQPKGNILTIPQINKTLLKEWIEYAQEQGMIVFLDHQIGKYDPVESLASMFPYLKYPNVHLALDPEWRTEKPMLEFGSVTGDEVNRAQEAMRDYMVKNNIEGERMLVIHQFKEVMIRNRAVIKSDFEHVQLVHCMDGIGTPKEKLDTYKYNALAKNMPVKAFKLFYDFKLPGVLVDTPLLTPKEVYTLDPRPTLIMYQ
ncbi:MAG: hypothetical protein LBD86_06085 [Spirochaetaceae bacterium]|jgi:hypothetical protein|nr:hypothetical protein [Spirochaetaceae bacterium]